MKLIILDRDGVLNEDSDDYIKSVDEWIPLQGSAEAVGRLCKAGYTIAVATNQSGLARGYFTQADLDAMHAKMTALAAAEGGSFAHIAFCPHGPDDDCDCRKPLPGLIHQIEQALKVSAQGCWMVGDSIRDLEAGVAAGCKPALVRTGKGAKSEAKLAATSGLETAPVFDDLRAFADFLLQ
ncbi:D-glycero-beta-D-manno-heptose 1,7-bisphosphate 7-phosphatase [Thalassolituus sp. LLYu03]|uniref:D-glycero-beta-D-manno-heptose 1,7-bisphosphate 7-phosphatase n=1 Tax=Thalassolituus sp. LLYu03 TaxID=3421656 RepID=UPI003D267ED5